MVSHLTLDQAIVGSSPTSSAFPRSHRLAVRTPASHVGNTGSIPVGTTIRLASLAHGRPLPAKDRDRVHRFVFSTLVRDQLRYLFIRLRQTAARIDLELGQVVFEVVFRTVGGNEQRSPLPPKRDSCIAKQDCRLHGNDVKLGFSFAGLAQRRLKMTYQEITKGFSGLYS